MQKITVLSKIALIIFLYYLTYYIFIGLKNPIPAAGDSLDYHIPISLSILNGDFSLSSNFQTFHYLNFSQTFHKMPQWYYPGASEAINSVFILLGIPLTLSNIFAVGILAFTLYKLGRAFNLEKNYSLLFSLGFVSLNAVIRWLNAVSVDFWVAIWFSWAIILLENPKKTAQYFAKLGFALGMLIGSKFIALYLFLSLFIIYFKKIFRVLNFERLLSFAIPFSLGIFWYVRNLALTNNPFYPVAILGFKGPFYESERIMTQIINHPTEMLNAFYSEYHLWAFSALIAVFFIAYEIYKRKFQLNAINKLFILGLVGLVFFLDFPSSAQPWIMVSSMRYSLPSFICLILGIFLLAKKWGKEEFLGYFAIGNMINILSMVYYPKLLLISLPISGIIIYLMDKSRTKLERS